MTIITQQVLDALHSYNEAEVRFHIIDPVLKKLGFPGGDDVYLKLEEKLDYPYFHIGHKSKKKDLPLGFPDYRAGLKGRRGSFIIEAKAANVCISEKDVEQAHSYAAHAQVGANYFVLCDGEIMALYETLSGPKNMPIVKIPIVEIDNRFHELDNILSPIKLAKNCYVSYDSGLKLCDGLESSVRIHSGEYSMDDWAWSVFINGEDCTEPFKTSVPQLAEIDNQLALMKREFDLKVRDGITERDVDGRISACVNFSGVTKNNLAAMKLLGVDKMTFSTNEEFLSVEKDSPTVFEATADFSMDKGTMIPPLFGGAIPADTDIGGDVFITARMHLEGDAIIGEYSTITNYRLGLADMRLMIIELKFTGNFTLRLIV